MIFFEISLFEKRNNRHVYQEKKAEGLPNNNTYRSSCRRILDPLHVGRQLVPGKSTQYARLTVGQQVTGYADLRLRQKQVDKHVKRRVDSSFSTPTSEVRI